MNINMKFNSKYITLFLIISALLFCVSSVCAQDTNATNNINNINNDMGQIPVVNDVNTTSDIGQISHTVNNSTNDSKNSTAYQHIVDFADEKIDIIPLINSSLNSNNEYIENYTYVGVNDGDNFNFLIDHLVPDGNNTAVRLSLTYNFNKVKSISDIISKLESGDYSNSIMLTRIVHVNSVESYERACKTPKIESFDSRVIAACFGIFDKKYVKTVNKTFSTVVGREACLTELKKYAITFNYNVLFDDAYTFNKNTVWDLNALDYNIVRIDGHGSTICGDAKERTEYKWANIGENYLFVNNITIKRFNNAIVNRGVCTLDNVIFRENKMKYRLDRDWGAGILNAGNCFCNNCSFIDNYASKGAAVFNQGEIHLNNCTFSGNKAYRGDKFNNVLNVNDGKVFFNGYKLDKNNATWNNGLVTYDSSLSLVWIGAASSTLSLVAGGIIGYATGGAWWSKYAAGAAGGVIGSIFSLAVNSNYYDINFNVKPYALIVISASVLSGVAGAAIGGHIYKATHPQTNINNGEGTEEDDSNSNHSNLIMEEED